MVPMLLAVAGSMLVARRIESRSIYTLRFHVEDPRPRPALAPQSPHLERLISRDFLTVSAAAGYGQVARLLLSSPSNRSLYVLDHEGQLLGTIDAESLKNAPLGAMPIEAAKAGDLAREVPLLDSQMSEQEVLHRLAGTSDHDRPVVDAQTGRMIGVIVNKKSG